MGSLDMKYFVLKPRSKKKDDVFALASRQAMLAYARVIEHDEPNFARELRTWADFENNLEYNTWHKIKED